MYALCGVLLYIIILLLFIFLADAKVIGDDAKFSLGLFGGAFLVGGIFLQIFLK